MKRIRRFGAGLLCLALLLSMMGCSNNQEEIGEWVPPATTGQSMEDYVTKEFVEKYIAEHFSGVEYIPVDKVLVDNTIEFSAWNGKTKILSSEDNRVSFTTKQEGSFGIYKKVVVDTSKPVYIRFSADYDIELVKLNLNIFVNGKSISAKAVPTGMKQYEIDVSSATMSQISVIISSTGTKDNLDQAITISGMSIWQEEEKLSVGVSADHDKIVEIVENANLTSSRFYAAPNGDRYQLQVSAEGELVMVPIIPSKSLFIGNSLLVGFGFGMAASDSEHDYYHLINKAIYERNSDYVPSKMSGREWEAADTREEQQAFLNDLLAPRLSEDLNLVVIQLGENISSTEKRAIFAEGCREMLEFIRTRCPKARVVWVGAWYQTPEKLEAMQQGCANTGCTFIDINDLSTPANKNAIGNTWTDTKGVEHVITTMDVATHPSDEGFRKIANRVLYKLGIVDVENYYEGTDN